MCLGVVPLCVVRCFIWDFFEMSWRRTDETLLLHTFERFSRPSFMTSWRHTIEMSWWRSKKTSLVVSFETYQRCWWDTKKGVFLFLPGGLFYLLCITWFTSYTQITDIVYAAVQHGCFICTFTFMGITRGRSTTGIIDWNWAQIRNNLYQLPGARG